MVQDEPAAESGYAPLRRETRDGPAMRLTTGIGDGVPAPLNVGPPEPLPESKASNDRRAFALAVGGHVLLLVATLVRLSPAPPPLPTSAAMSVTYVVVPGDPPPGKPEGDDAPPPAEKAEAKPAASAERESTDGDAPAAEDAPPSEDPSPERDETPSVPIPADGDGSLALGARTLGDAQGLDPSLMASVGQAIATRVRACWTPPKAAPDGIAVRIVARFSPDGSLSAPPSVVTGDGPGQQVVTAPDNWQKEAADAIVRCSPLTLPSFLYPYWREVEIQIYSTKG
jgi:hypothetical protein